VEALFTKKDGKKHMKLEDLIEIEKGCLDLDILAITCRVKQIFESGEAMIVIDSSDDVERIGKLIRYAISCADGAVVQIRELNENFR